MFDYQYAAFVQVIICEHLVWYGLYALHLIWRVCKNQVIAVRRVLKKAEHVLTHYAYGFHLQFACHLLDERDMPFAHLYRSDAQRTARGKFVADAARSGKEVECSAAFDVYPVVYQVEQTFLGEVGCGPRRDIGWRIEAAAFELSADYAHIRLYSCVAKRW